MKLYVWQTALAQGRCTVPSAFPVESAAPAAAPDDTVSRASAAASSPGYEAAAAASGCESCAPPYLNDICGFVGYRNLNPIIGTRAAAAPCVSGIQYQQHHQRDYVSLHADGRVCLWQGDVSSTAAPPFFSKTLCTVAGATCIDIPERAESAQVEATDPQPAVSARIPPYCWPLCKRVRSRCSDFSPAMNVQTALSSHSILDTGSDCREGESSCGRSGRCVIAVGKADGSIALYTRQTHADEWVEENIEKAHATAVSAVAWNRDGTALASTADDGRLKIWVDRGQLGCTVAVCEAAITCVRWSRTGDLLVYGNADGCLGVARASDQPSSATASSFSPSESPSASASSSSSTSVSFTTRKCGNSRHSRTHASSRNSGSDSGSSSSYYRAENTRGAASNHSGSSCCNVKSSSDGNHDPRRTKRRGMFWKGHEGGAVMAVDWNEKWKLLLSGGEDGKYCLWTSSGELLQCCRAPDDASFANITTGTGAGHRPPTAANSRPPTAARRRPPTAAGGRPLTAATAARRPATAAEKYAGGAGVSNTTPAAVPIPLAAFGPDSHQDMAVENASFYTASGGDVGVSTAAVFAAAEGAALTPGASASVTLSTRKELAAAVESTDVDSCWCGRTREGVTIVSSVAWSPNEELLAVGGYNWVAVCNRRGQLLTQNFSSVGLVHGLCWSGNCQSLAFAGEPGTLGSAWLLPDPMRWKHFEVSFSPDALHIADVKAGTAAQTVPLTDSASHFAVGFGVVVVATGRQTFVYPLLRQQQPPERASAANGAARGGPHYVDNLEQPPLFIKQGRQHVAVVQPTQIQVLDYVQKLTKCTIRRQAKWTCGNLSPATISVATDLLCLIALNQLGRYDDRLVAALDEGGQLWIASLQKRSWRKLKSFIDCFLWEESTDVLVGLSRGQRLCCWPFPLAAFLSRSCLEASQITKEVEEKCVAIKHSEEGLVYLGTGNGGCLQVFLFPYSRPLYQHYEAMRWDEAVRLCRLVKDSAAWGCLAAMALYKKAFAATEEALAAIGEAPVVHMLQQLKQNQPSEQLLEKHEARVAAAAQQQQENLGKEKAETLQQQQESPREELLSLMLSNNVNEAVQLLLQNDHVDAALDLCMRMQRWQEALGFAIAHNPKYVNNVLEQREQLLLSLRIEETEPSFIAAVQQRRQVQKEQAMSGEAKKESEDCPDQLGNSFP